jgi:hypothetical protein
VEANGQNFESHFEVWMESGAARVAPEWTEDLDEVPDWKV